MATPKQHKPITTTGRPAGGYPLAITQAGSRPAGGYPTNTGQLPPTKPLVPWVRNPTRDGNVQWVPPQS